MEKELNKYDGLAPIHFKTAYALMGKSESNANFIRICDTYAMVLKMSIDMTNKVMDINNYETLTDQIKSITIWEDLTEIAEYHMKVIKTHLIKYKIKGISSPGIAEVVKYVEVTSASGKYVSLTEIKNILARSKRVAGARKKITPL